MERFNPVLYQWLFDWTKDLERLARDFPDDLPGQYDDGITLTHLKSLQSQCERLGFQTTSHHLFLLIACIEAGRGFSEIGSLGSSIHESLFIELQTTVFLALNPSMAQHYTEPSLGWKLAIGKFPKIEYDAQAATRCLALGESTACVFHLMRVCEIGLRLLAARLDVKINKKSLNTAEWEELIKAIENTTRAIGNTQRTPARDRRLQFYAEAATHFWQIKSAFRNHVAHAHSTYDEREARLIWNHVTAFMEHLAKGPSGR